MSCTKLFGLIEDHDWYYVDSIDKNTMLLSFGLPPLPDAVGATRQAHHRVCLKCKTIDNQIAKLRVECVRRQAEMESRRLRAVAIIRESEIKVAEDRESQLHKGQFDG